MLTTAIRPFVSYHNLLFDFTAILLAPTNIENRLQSQVKRLSILAASSFPDIKDKTGNTFTLNIFG